MRIEVNELVYDNEDTRCDVSFGASGDVIYVFDRVVEAQTGDNSKQYCGLWGLQEGMRAILREGCKWPEQAGRQGRH